MSQLYTSIQIRHQLTPLSNSLLTIVHLKIQSMLCPPLDPSRRRSPFDLLNTTIRNMYRTVSNHSLRKNKPTEIKAEAQVPLLCPPFCIQPKYRTLCLAQLRWLQFKKCQMAAWNTTYPRKFHFNAVFQRRWPSRPPHPSSNGRYRTQIMLRYKSHPLRDCKLQDMGMTKPSLPLRGFRYSSKWAVRKARLNLYGMGPPCRCRSSQVLVGMQFGRGWGVEWVGWVGLQG